MGWLKLDDGFAVHPKILALTDRERWAWLKVLLYCARYRTEGDVPESAFSELGIAAPTRSKFVAMGLLDEDEDGFLSVHDWGDFNKPDPTNAQRQKRWRERQKAARVTQKRNGTRNAKSNDETVTDNGESLARGRAGSRAGARDPSTSTSTSTWVEEEGVAGSPGEREGELNRLPPAKQHHVLQLLNTIGKDADAGTAGVLRSLAHRLPESSLARARESLLAATDVGNRAGYAVSALKSELAEREAGQDIPQPKGEAA